MKTRFVNCFLLATAVGIYFPASQLTANEQSQPIETTQPLDAAGPEDAPEQDTDLAEDLTVDRGAVESSDPAGPLVSNETVADVLLEWYGIPSAQIEEVVDVDDNVPTLAEEAAEEEATEIVADDAQREDLGLAEGSAEWYGEWYGESAVEAFREEAAAVDETVEPAEAVEVENDMDGVDSLIDEANGDETVYIVEAEEAEATEATEEVTANEELVDEAGAFEHSSEDSDEGHVTWEDAIEELIEELTAVEETVEPAEAVEVENAIDSAIDDATSDDSAEYVEAEATTDVDATEDLAIDEALPVAGEEVPGTSEEFYEGDVASDELVEDAAWDQDFNEWFDEGEYGADVWIEEEAAADETVDAAEAILVEDHVEAMEPASEEAVSAETPVAEVAEETNAQVTGEEIAVEETVEVTEVAEDEGSLITETLAEDRFESEATEDVQYIVAGPSSVTEETFEEHISGDVDTENLDSDAVDAAVENEETLDVAESLIEEATQPEAEVDETPAAELDYDATVRTMEFPNWKVIVESEQPMDDHQLLNMLRAAVYQLEAELD